MSDPGRTTRSFEELQADLRAHFTDRGISELTEGTIVVLPSITFPPEELRKIVGIIRYEERLLCLLLWLRSPALKVVFISSLPVDRSVLDYYLSFLPDPEDARRRLTLVSLDQPETGALSQKLVGHPSRLDGIRDLIRAGPTYLLPFNVTPWERFISEALDVPIYGPSPDLAELGSKSGSRRAARAAGVPVLEGSEDLFSLDEIDAALDRLKERRPDATHAVIKLNYGFSGQGNAIVDLTERASSIDEAPTVFCADEESWETFRPKIEREGAIVEELLQGTGVHSPSAQMRIVPHGDIEIVSTHDQILGGPDDQVYLGCRFPARDEYRLPIQEHAVKIASELAEHGVIGTFGMDFLVTAAPESKVYLSEINLRMGGTTHPYLMTHLATGGVYDEASGLLTCNGATKFYIATDNLKADAYKALKAGEVISLIEDEGLAFDDSTRKGVMLHLLGALTDYGKLGMTCVGDSRAEADTIYEQAVAALDALAGRRRS
ncbi:MAG: peptide ligase PGM1-related protein [Actinomycetota bacterium]